MAARARGEGKTPHRQFRLEGDLWEKFEAAATQAGADRSTVLRAFVMWFVREQGAKMPKRPPTAESNDAGNTDSEDPDTSA